MRKAPILSFILSIVVGIAAVVFGRGWLNSEADASHSPAIVVEEIETSQILVASVGIQRGDLLNKESFELVDWPVEHLPAGAIKDTSTIVSDDGDYPYALGVMVPGEPLLAGKLSPHQVRDRLATIIEPGFRAVSVEVDDATGVSGFILPDARVDVYAYIKHDDPVTGIPVYRGQTLLTNIRVLGVDQIFTDNLEGTALAQTVTLQVTPVQGRTLGLASVQGEIRLALHSEEEETFLPPPPPPVKRRAAPKKRFKEIRVIQGETENVISAPVARTQTRTSGQK